MPAVDEAGNDRAGIRLPEITVPLATHAGWNYRDAVDRRAGSAGGRDRIVHSVRAQPRGSGTNRRSADRRSRSATRDVTSTSGELRPLRSNSSGSATCCRKTSQMRSCARRSTGNGPRGPRTAQGKSRRAKGKLKRAIVCLVVSFMATWSVDVRVQQRTPADRVLINGQVLTVDANDSVAQAVAISGGRIVAVGSTVDIRTWIGGSTDVIDLRGRTATPGLIDTHVHFSEVEPFYSIDLGATTVKNMDDVLRLVAAQVAKSKPGEWVRGRGWDEGKLAERRYITAADLDKVAPDNPVWLGQTTGHYGVANSYAMKMAEVRKDTRDPPAGTIDRDAQGGPTGVMKESAQGLITRLVPPYTRRPGARGARASRRRVQQGRDDRGQGSGHRSAEVGSLQPASSRMES